VGSWENIWKGEGAQQLWSIADPRISELADTWRQSGGIHRVLDLGCGVGRHLCLFASEGFEVYGLDHSESGLETCRRRLHLDGLTADLRLGDMSTIPFPNDYFDAGVEQVCQKLRVGGICYATFLSRDNRLYGKGHPIEPHTFDDPRMYKELLGGDGESGVTHHFSSEEEVRHFFRAYEIDSLEHEELRLALPSKNGTVPRWLPIRHSYFWHIVARKVDRHA